MELTIRDFRRMALSFDPQFSRLKTIIEGLNNAIEHLYGSELCIDWHGTIDEKHECETIYRLAILAFESYIISSAKNLSNENENPEQFYNLLPEINLVLALAEYLKSNNENCTKIFELYNLSINDYPIYNGIKTLNTNRSLSQIMKILKSWRNQVVYIQYRVDNDD